MNKAKQPCKDIVYRRSKRNQAGYVFGSFNIIKFYIAMRSCGIKISRDLNAQIIVTIHLQYLQWQWIRWHHIQSCQ